jgi:type IV secretory pathway VirB6-like protein
MPAIQYFNFLIDAMRQLMQAYTGVFVSEGQTLFRLAAIIAIALFGCEWALSGWDVNQGLNKFFDLLLLVGFTDVMVTYYDVAIPGLGMSFPAIITREAEWLANTITQAEIATLVNRLATFYQSMEVPGITDVTAMLCYIIIVALLIVCGALAFVMVAFGLIAEAVCVLLGPVFIPWLLLPRMDWLFWGWIRSLAQYAFFQVVAAAVVYIIGNTICPALDVLPPTIPVETLVGYIMVLPIMLIAGIYALLRIPQITNSIFSGNAGGGLGNAVISAGSAAVGALMG